MEQTPIETLESQIAALDARRVQLVRDLGGATNAATNARRGLANGTGEAARASDAQGYADALRAALRDVEGQLETARDELAREQTKADSAARAARCAAICREAVALRGDVAAHFDEARAELRARAEFFADGAARLAELRRELQSLGGRHFDAEDTGRGGRFVLAGALPHDPNEPGTYGVQQAFMAEVNRRENALRDARPVPREARDPISFELDEPADARPARFGTYDERDFQSAASHEVRRLERTTL